MEPKVIHYVIGDATRPIKEPAVIAHVCNDVGAWGSGFVLALSKRWKAPEREYHAEFWRGIWLGAVQLVKVEPRIHVANMIAQRGLRHAGNPVPLRYDALATCLAKVRLFAERGGYSVHMPRIGCGLAGGSWDQVEEVVARQLDGIDVCVYDLPTK